jgi:hypothetical protein
MKKVLKLLSLSLVVLLAFFSLNIKATTGDYTEVLVNGNAEAYGRYRVEENKVDNLLPYGIKQRTDISYLSAGEGMVTAMGHGVDEPFVPGKEYPQQVNIMEVPSTTDVKITSWSTLGNTYWNLNTVRAIVGDYEAKNPGYKVIGAINGDFFDIRAEFPLPKTTNGAQVSNGDFFKSQSGSTVGFKNDGSVDSLVAGTPTRTPNMILNIYDKNNNITHEFEIEKKNATPGDNETAIYYPYWTGANLEAKTLNKQTVTNAKIVTGAEYSFGYSMNDYYGRGIITEVGNKSLEEGDFAIVTNNPELETLLNVGVKIRAQYEYTGAFADVKDATGAGATVLKNGELNSVSDKARHPRTMIGRKADGTIVMGVVDGRQPGVGLGLYGASQVEMAALMKHYGAVDAYNLDGGGSSTMVIIQDGQFKVMNTPSDGGERSDANAVLVVVKIPEIDFAATEVLTDKLSFNVNVENENGHDLTELYAGVGDEIKLVTNNKVSFDKLTYNTGYVLTFYKKNGDELIDMALKTSISTAKRDPYANYVYMYYNNKDLVIEVDFNDVDLAIERSNIKIGDKTAFVTNGKATFKNFDDSLGDVIVDLQIDLNNGKGRVSFVPKATFRYQADILIEVIQDKTNNKIHKMFK